MRIVSLSSSITETLEALGLSRDLAGVTNDCALNPDCINIGSPKALLVDTIKDLKPDVIVTAYAENRPEEIRALENFCRVVSYKVLSIPQAVSAINELGNLFERQNEARELIRKIYVQWPAPAQAANPVRTLVLLWNAPFLTVNANTYPSGLIEAAGGWNVFREDPVSEIPIELEDMSDQKPDLILLPTDPYPFTAQHVDYFKGIPVFSKKKIALVDGRLFSRFGPRTVEALRTLREIIENAGVGQESK